MTSTFHPFPDLPKELRLKIWEQAMIEARPNRRMLIYNGHIVPFKQFNSPLLFVNYESRECAKAFYNVKLDIYAVPPVSKDEIRYLDKQKNWNRIEGIERAVNGEIHGYSDIWVEKVFELEREEAEYIFDGPFDGQELDDALDRINKEEKEFTVDLENHWSEFVRAELNLLGASAVRKLETSGPTTGVLYISPEHDVFVHDYDCGAHFCLDSASEIMGADFPSLQGPACHHISVKLSAAIRRRVSTLVIMRTRRFWSNKTKHCVFAQNKVVPIDRCFSEVRDSLWQSKANWRKKAYPHVCAHFVLRQREDEPHGFLEILTGVDDAQISHRFEKWTKKAKYSYLRKEMMSGLEMTKNCDSLNGKADWVRDLMAHWDINK